MPDDSQLFSLRQGPTAVSVIVAWSAGVGYNGVRSDPGFEGLNQEGPMRSWRAGLMAFAAATVAACATPRDPGWVELPSTSMDSGQVLQITGTVHRLEVEGGIFVIRDAQGTQYNPTNLPDAFRKDGLRVEAEARRRDDMVSIGMVGPIIELRRIRQTGTS